MEGELEHGCSGTQRYRIDKAATTDGIALRIGDRRAFVNRLEEQIGRSNEVLVSNSHLPYHCLVTHLFGDNDTARLVVLLEPDATSTATLAAFIEKMSDTVDKKKVLTIEFTSK